MNTIKAVLFDMDGTLVDTEPCGLKALKDTLSQFDLTIRQEEWTLFDKVWRRDGTDITEDVFFSDYVIKTSGNINQKNFEKVFYKIYEENIIKADPLPGANQLLKRLKGQYRLAIVTASTQAQAQAVLKQHVWGDIFDAVISFDQYQIKKPDPISYLMAAEKLAVLPDECMVVEDSKNGALAGKNAGMYVVGVRAGNKVQIDLSAANKIIQTLNEFPI